MKLNYFFYFLLLVAAVASPFFNYPWLVWFGLISVITLVMYGIDKLLAIKQWQRIPEATLLISGLLGGWVGAIVGRQLFHHKTEKTSFNYMFVLTVILNIASVAGIGYWTYGRFIF